MQKETDYSTEQSILAAAEHEFLSKGFAGAKMTEIAKQAGINHAMLHYYFRTKENLFNLVFEKQAVILADSFLTVFEQDLPFFEKLKMGIEGHFDIIAANPQLPFFIFSEILNDEKRKKMFLTIMLSKVGSIFQKLQETIDIEVAKKNIQPIAAVDLMLNIMSLNIFVFMARPVLETVLTINNGEYKAFLQHRKQVNVDLIINSLKK